MINKHVRSLNEEQRKVFHVLHKWSKDFVKNLGSKRPQTTNLFHIFITGGGGVGKSDLILHFPSFSLIEQFVQNFPFIVHIN